MTDFFSALQKNIGYTFVDSNLCVQALTHRSYGAHHNERLEFLGDAILDLLVAETLYLAHPSATEGQLSAMRAGVVCGEQLAQVGNTLRLGEAMLLGAGEVQTGGRQRVSIIADAVEALVAAVYLDGGMESCRYVVQRLFASVIAMQQPHVGKDAKTTLQEYLQARQSSLPQYELVKRSGDDHNARFLMACVVPGLGLRAEAEASSRKKAEQLAAGLVLQKLGI